MRVHSPENYGDKIQRTSLTQAIKNQKSTFSIEQGILGTLTLRYVSPWRDQQQKIIGYIELGIDIPEILHQIESKCKHPLVLGIQKSLLSEKSWHDPAENFEEMRLPWNTHPNYALVEKYTDSSIQQIPLESEFEFYSND